MNLEENTHSYSTTVSKSLLFAFCEATLVIPFIMLLIYFLANAYPNFGHKDPATAWFISMLGSGNFLFLTVLVTIVEGYFQYFENSKTTYQIFNDRVIHSERFLNESDKTIMFVEADSAELSASVFEKYFNVGTVRIIKRNTPQPFVLRGIHEPRKAFEFITKQIAEFKNQIRVKQL